MGQERRFYRLTSEGRALWERRESLPLPVEFRRVLGMVDFNGYPEVIHTYLARFPTQDVDRWLTEFEALRLIESISAADVKLDEISKKSPPPVEVEDVRDTAPEVSFADMSLTRLGVYVAYDRVANRPTCDKSPRDTVALVVEDDPDQLALAVLRLTSAGYAVRTAASVKALFESLQQGVPDAIFLDIGLPDGDGFEVLTTLRQHPAYAHVPIIMLTARKEAEEVARGLALEADGYITKPYGRNTLDYALRYVLKQAPPSSQAAAAPRGRRSA
ncbi:MAG: response regulator [Burkholderiales bacterium]